LLIFLFWK